MKSKLWCLDSQQPQQIFTRQVPPIRGVLDLYRQIVPCELKRGTIANVKAHDEVRSVQQNAITRRAFATLQGHKVPAFFSIAEGRDQINDRSSYNASFRLRRVAIELTIVPYTALFCSCPPSTPLDGDARMRFGTQAAPVLTRPVRMRARIRRSFSLVDPFFHRRGSFL